MKKNKNYQKNFLHFKNGFVTLIAVIIVLAAASIIAISLILLGIGFSNSSVEITKSNQAKAIANACAESALQQIRNNSSYTGTGNLTISSGSCTYIVTAQSGENRTITSSATVGSVIRKVKVIINQINPKIQFVSWTEVSNF